MPKRYNHIMHAEESSSEASEVVQTDETESPDSDKSSPREIGGRKSGLDPTRYGDWEKNGRCIDF